MSVPLLQILPPLPPEELLTAAILEQGQRLCLSAGEFLQANGENVSAIYYVKDGLARTFRETSEGDRKTLHIIGRGYFLFESYYFSRKPLQIYCTAIKELVLYRFAHDIIGRLMVEERDFAKALTRSMGLKMQLMGYDLVSSAYVKPETRLKLCLISLALAIGEKCQKGISLQLTQHELAELVGLHRVTVTRALNKLQQTALLFIGRGNLLLCEDFFMDEEIAKWHAFPKK